MTSVLFQRSREKLPKSRCRVDLRQVPVSIRESKVARMEFRLGSLPTGYQVVRYLSVHGAGIDSGMCVADVRSSERSASGQDDRALDAVPSSRESMRARNNRRSDKVVSLNFGALKRFLNSRVGRNWREVQGEIRRSMSIHSFAGNELQKCVKNVVCLNVQEEDGKLICVESGKELCEKWQFYVHPLTGELQPVPRPTKRSLHEQEMKRLFSKTFEQVAMSDLQKLVKVNGIWYVVDFKPIPTLKEYAEEVGLSSELVSLSGRWLGEYNLMPQGPKDIFLDEGAIDNSVTLNTNGRYQFIDFRIQPFVEAWGAKIYAVSKRQANSAEMRKHGVKGG